MAAVRPDQGDLVVRGSVYQMRFFSVQVARLPAQAAASVTIWRFLAETGGSPLENSGVSQTPWTRAAW
ncbi:DUF6185 family protein [Streptomyces azureus]|uniref:Uncharacterized protein n=1 Tax=Streptomyces azureus TaxID=146537 RepID=A0A0K8PH53_STRAJ|nr:DUF6185 family protein [Streptomyces azureus]GAP47053.1 predicted protein [Streptomyces azureus]